MKTSLLSVASVLAVVAATPAVAANDHACIDQLCSSVTLFAAGDDAAGGGAALIEAPRFGTWGIDTSGMDRSVKPGDDFFGYANGNWAKKTEIPADRSSFGAFDQLRELSRTRVKNLVESYRLDSADFDQRKVAMLYKAYMDEAAVERLDATPLLSRLGPVFAARSKEDVARLMGQSNAGLGNSLFGTFVSGDARRPTHYALYLAQSGLGLGDRELYLDQGKFGAQKDRYRQYVAQMLEMAGWPDPKGAAGRIVDFETKIAEAHWTRAESRSQDKTYNPATFQELEQQAPGFPWATFFKAAGVDHASRVVVKQNTAMPKIAKIFTDADLQTLKAWYAFSVADQMAPYLSKRFLDAHFEFRRKFMYGQPQQEERWKQAVTFLDGAIGEAIGRDYVALYFKPDAKVKMDALVGYIKSAMRARIEKLDWMGPKTKEEALGKLSKLNLKIGYPEKWRDYSALQVSPGDLVGNIERAMQFEWNFQRKRIEQPVDKGEWSMTPQTVNAYYSGTQNEIVFSAAILQPPFFDPDADPAVNFGAIGAVIGHEISHGFDDQGRKYDGDGVLREWWQPEDSAKFETQAAKLGAQYESYTFPTLPGLKINGRVAMGENIGDLGGVLLALEAYQNYRKDNPASVIDGFTPEQRLFLGWAQVWRTLWRDDALRQKLTNGSPHSPGHIRAFAPFRNIDVWYDAFGVKPDDKLYVAPEDRVRIW